MHPEVFQRTVWEEMLYAQMRSNYIAELVRHYMNWEKGLRAFALLASSGAAVTIIAQASVDVLKFGTPVVAAAVNFWLFRLAAIFDPQARIATLERELNWAHLKIQSLTEELRQQRIRFLGPRSETLSDLQLELLADEEPDVSAAEVEAEAQREPIGKMPPRQRKPHPGRKPLPEHLPRVEEVVACPLQNCPGCGAETAVIGCDESEQLDVEPAGYLVRVIKREKRTCRCCQTSTVTMPELQPRIVEKGLASDRVVVQTVIGKYCDHLPLYRQATILEREAGVEIGRATLDGWVMRVGELLEPVTAAMGQDLRKASLSASRRDHRAGADAR
jgi:transposase